MKNQMVIYVIVAGVLAGCAGFFGGMKYQQSKQPSFGSGNFRQFAGRDGQFNGRGGGQNGSPNNGQMMGRGSVGRVVGEILSMDDKSITVKLQDGSSKIVLIGDNTNYTKSETGAKTDLKSGVVIGVFGITNTDGSVTAQDVQINPIFGGTLGNSSQTKIDK